MPRTSVLSTAVLAFGFLCFFCLHHAPMIQADVSDRVVHAMAANEITSRAMTVDGRDVLLSGPVNSAQVSESTQKLVASVEGVRTVSIRTTTPVVDPHDPQPDAKTAPQAKVDTLLQRDIVEFDPSSARLTPHGREVLDQIAPLLLASPALNCEIQGHTDSLGNAEANRDLSYRRAIATKNYLVNKGIAAEKLTTKGYGDTKPIASNDTAEGRRQNRRINFVIKEKL